MEATHTPGPWTTNGKSITKGARLIASTGFDVKDEGHVGNAHLIAAAPELLEALKAIWPFIEVDEYTEGDSADPYQWAIQRARAAIAKAEGK